MTALTRGPLPARVYWTRRVLLLVVVSALLVGVVQVVSWATGGGSPDPKQQAAPVSAEPTSEVTEQPVTDPSTPSESREQEREKKGTKGTKKSAEPVLAEPEGPCVDRDVAATPAVDEAVGGSPIAVTVELRTVQSVACTWELSPRTLSVKITSGDDPIWFSSQCPRSIRKQDLVLRNTEPTEVEVRWSSKRSDEDCSGQTDWALPGWYHVEVAALGGEPSDMQFQLTAPDRPVVTETIPVKPKQDGKKQGGKKQDGKKQDRKNRG
ncbi:hypothetical protein GCM10009623_23470 [Nocardioides aestuarii]|uniref:DUF4232 domain-containing protein n=1 Tax=Nocardioides aestuarii TaxID=252231 RepID=A0ABW4TPR5_9ACTN